MLSRIEGKKYLFTDDEGRFPFKVSKRKTDKTIHSLIKDLEHFQVTIKNTYKNDYELYNLIEGNLFFPDDWEYGRNVKLDAVINGLKCFEGFLSEDDEIPLSENILTLADFGFDNRAYGMDGLWEKVIENSEEKEVVEEIWPYDEVAKYRIRTTLWETIEPGYKKSKSITYKNKKIGKKLAQAIKNTKEREKKE